MKIAIPKPKPSRSVHVRFPVADYALLENESRKSGVKPSTLVRIVVIQTLKAGIEVN